MNRVMQPVGIHDNVYVCVCVCVGEMRREARFQHYKSLQVDGWLSGKWDYVFQRGLSCTRPQLLWLWDSS